MTERQIADVVWRKAMRTALNITKNTYVAEEAAAHTFRKIMSNLSQLDGRPVEGLAHVIARNKAIDLKEKHRNRNQVDILVHDVVVEDEPADYTFLHKALSKLAPKYLEVIILHYFEGMELQVIAERTDQKLGTVKARVHRARKQLLKHLTCQE